MLDKISNKKQKFNILKDYIRPYDRIISDDNNRFCIILPQTNGIGCSIVKERIYNLCGEYQLTNLSLGISVYPHDGTSATKLLKSAKEKLKNNKENAELQV